MKITPARVGLFYSVFGFAFFAIAINSQSHGWVEWYNLYRTGQQTQAVITKQQPETHQRCFFTYTVASHLFESWDDGCSELPIGEMVSVTYLPADPTFATLHSPKEEFTSLLAAPIILSMLAGVLTAWQTKSRQRRASK